jgi:hypothetical protein
LPSTFVVLSQLAAAEIDDPEGRLIELANPQALRVVAVDHDLDDAGMNRDRGGCL